MINPYMFFYLLRKSLGIPGLLLFFEKKLKKIKLFLDNTVNIRYNIIRKIKERKPKGLR